jgi:hypothetical protein
MQIRKENKSDFFYVEVSAFKPATEENFQLNLFTILLPNRT